MGDDLEKLVERAMRGDAEAIGSLYRIYEHEMIATAHDQLGHTLDGLMESVDLVQSTWKDVLDDIRGFEYRGPESFSRWLRVCLVNKIREKGRYFAAEKRDVRREQEIAPDAVRPEEAEGRIAKDPTPSEVAMGKEELHRLLLLLDRFEEPQRRVLILRMRDGMEYAEIAKTIGKSVEATRKMHGRALKKLVGLVEESMG